MPILRRPSLLPRFSPPVASPTASGMVGRVMIWPPLAFAVLALLAAVGVARSAWRADPRVTNGATLVFAVVGGSLLIGIDGFVPHVMGGALLFIAAAGAVAVLFSPAAVPRKAQRERAEDG